MIRKFDLIVGDIEDIREYIEGLDTFDSWQIGKNYYTQINDMLDRPGLQNHIGAVVYQGRDSDGLVTIYAAFIAITQQPMKFA